MSVLGFDSDCARMRPRSHPLLWRALVLPSLLALCACERELGAAPPPVAQDEQWPGLETYTPRTAARGRPVVRDGPLTEWHSSGAKSAEGELRDGRRHGPWNFFHENGVLRWQGTFEDGVAVGPERAWFENGNLQLEGTLVEGRREGIYRYWYDNGQPELEVEFRADLRDGTCRRWTRDGLLDRSSSGVYSKGRKVADL